MVLGHVAVTSAMYQSKQIATGAVFFCVGSLCSARITGPFMAWILYQDGVTRCHGTEALMLIITVQTYGSF
jgi:hypothetical protein